MQVYEYYFTNITIYLSTAVVVYDHARLFVRCHDRTRETAFFRFYFLLLHTITGVIRVGFARDLWLHHVYVVLEV